MEAPSLHQELGTFTRSGGPAPSSHQFGANPPCRSRRRAVRSRLMRSLQAAVARGVLRARPTARIVGHGGALLLHGACEEVRWVGLIRRLFGGSRGEPAQASIEGLHASAVESGDTLVELNVVGEGSYQEALARIAGPEAEGKHIGVGVTLRCEPKNTYDHNAVKVEVMGVCSRTSPAPRRLCCRHESRAPATEQSRHTG